MNLPKLLKLSLTYLIYSTVFSGVLTFSCLAEQPSIYAKPLEEFRIDFHQSTGKFKSSAGGQQMYDFKVGLNKEKNFEVILIPNELGKKEGWSSETYPAQLVYASPEIMLLQIKLAVENKVDLLALFPQQRVGYFMSTKAYLGMPNGKQLALANEKIPTSSANICPLILDVQNGESGN